MLSAHLTRSSLSSPLRRHLSSPSAYPALYHAVRTTTEPAAVFLRHHSSAPAVKTTTSDESSKSPATYRRRPSLFDLEDFFFSHDPFDLSPFDMAPFGRRMKHPLENSLEHGKFFSPEFHISSDDSSVKVTLDLPGVKVEDINMEVEDNKLLKITGNRKVERDGEISTLEFVRRFTLGNLVDLDSMSANLSEGVLTITAQKMEATEKARKIEITQNKVEKETGADQVVDGFREDHEAEKAA